MSAMSTMSQRYSIVEPHPSVNRTSQYISTGRGGAGNAVKPPSTLTRGSDASGPASLATLSQQPRNFHSGRGGAGNVHPSSERAIFSFDEELERQLSQERHAAPVYHVGRGGAGNVSAAGSSTAASTNQIFLRRKSEDSGRSGSSVSSETGADFATRNLKKGLKKMAGLV